VDNLQLIARAETQRNLREFFGAVARHCAFGQYGFMASHPNNVECLDRGVTK
jgi:hypothetical protein